MTLVEVYFNVLWHRLLVIGYWLENALYNALLVPNEVGPMMYVYVITNKPIEVISPSFDEGGRQSSQDSVPCQERRRQLALEKGKEEAVFRQ